MNCVITDDNKMARTAMKQLASQVADLMVVGECTNAMETYNLMNSQSIDVLFLDIEMPEMTGIELTRHLGDKKPIIVFTTSKKEYAVDAFELNVADYIVKPVTPHRFLQAVEKVREIYDSNKVEVSVEEKEFVFIRDNGVLKRLLIEDIHFLEAMGDYVKLYTQQKFHAVHTTLKNVEDKLPSNKFLRVHRSYTANTYAAGQVLFDVNDPTKVIARLDKPFFVPTEPFEKSGQYPAGTVFVEGMVYYQNKWFLYYGCADSRVGVAIYDPSKYK